MEQNYQFSVLGPYRHSDKSWMFTLIVMEPSPVIGGPATVVGKVEVHAKDARASAAAGSALLKIAAEHLPELETARVANVVPA